MQSVNLESLLTSDYKDLNKGLSADIIQKIDAIHLLLLKAGYPTRRHTGKAVQALIKLDEARKNDILQNLTHWHQILSSAESCLDDVSESYLVDKALKYFKFRLKDHDWIDKAQNEIIEIYNPHGIQLYRSMNFFNTCGYSLLDLCVNEWFILWERPKYILEKMHRTVTDVLSGKKKDPNFTEVGPHLIRETYDDGSTQPFHPRAAMVEFKSIYPAYGFLREEIIGFVVTSKGTLISEGDEALSVSFI